METSECNKVNDNWHSDDNLMITFLWNNRWPPVHTELKQAVRDTVGTFGTVCTELYVNATSQKD